MELHKDDPFTVIGINTDSDLEDYAKKAADRDITWRNAWCPSPSGGIPGAYSVTGFPTVILVDADGMAVWQGHFFEGDESFQEALASALEGARKDA